MTHQKRCAHFVLQVAKQRPKETQAPLALAAVSNEGMVSARSYASRKEVYKSPKQFVLAIWAGIQTVLYLKSRKKQRGL